MKMEALLLAVAFFISFWAGFYIGREQMIEAAMKAAEIRCLLGV